MGDPPRRLASGRVDHELIHQTNPLILTNPYGGGIYASPLPPSTAPARSPVGGCAGLGGLPDLYKTNEKSTFSPSGPPRGHHAGQKPPKTVPRPSQEAPRPPQEAPRRPQEASRPSQDSPKRLQDSSRKHQDRPERLQDHLKKPQDSPKSHQNHPRSLKISQKSTQERPKTSQDHPCSQDTAGLLAACVCVCAICPEDAPKTPQRPP